jgi:hypothetical protein
MPDSIRHPVLPLDSAKASHVPGVRQNDKHKVFIRRINMSKSKITSKKMNSVHRLISIIMQL